MIQKNKPDILEEIANVLDMKSLSEKDVTSYPKTGIYEKVFDYDYSEVHPDYPEECVLTSTHYSFLKRKNGKLKSLEFPNNEELVENVRTLLSKDQHLDYIVKLVLSDGPCHGTKTATVYIL